MTVINSLSLDKTKTLVEFFEKSLGHVPEVIELDQIVDMFIVYAQERSRQELASPTEFVGYLWKKSAAVSIFLPYGTLLAIDYKGITHIAEVQDGKILYKKGCHTPSNFSFEVTGSNQSCWETIWIKRPYDPGFKRANNLIM